MKLRCPTACLSRSPRRSWPVHQQDGRIAKCGIPSQFGVPLFRKYQCANISPPASSSKRHCKHRVGHNATFRLPLPQGTTLHYIVEEGAARAYIAVVKRAHLGARTYRLTLPAAIAIAIAGVVEDVWCSFHLFACVATEERVVHHVHALHPAPVDLVHRPPRGLEQQA